MSLANKSPAGEASTDSDSQRLSQPLPVYSTSALLNSSVSPAPSHFSNSPILNLKASGLRPPLSPSISSNWSDQQKTEFAYMLLKQVSTSTLATVTDRLLYLLQRDFIAALPSELASHILGFTDHLTVIHASQVSRKWRTACRDNAVWRTLFYRNGWSVNQAYLDTILHLPTNSSRQTIPSFRIIPTPGSIGAGTTRQYIGSPVNSATLPLLELRRDSVASTIRRDSLHAIHFDDDSLVSQDSGFLEKLGVGSATLSGFLPIFEDGGFPAIEMDAGDKGVDVWSGDQYKAVDWKLVYVERYKIDCNWRRGVAGAVVREIVGHEEAVYCVQFDRDKVISGSRDSSTIKIWDLESGACRQTLAGHTSSVLCLQYDSQHLISGSSDATIIIWDLTTGRILKTLHGHTEHVLGICFDSTKIVSCSRDKTARVWDFNGSCVRVLKGHRAAVNCVCFVGNLVVTASGDRSIKVWDAGTGDVVRNLVGHERDNNVKVWDIQTGTCLATLEGHTDLVRTLHFDKSWIVTGGYDESVRVWDRRSLKLVAELRCPAQSRVYKLQVAVDKIVCCTQDSKILVWDFVGDLD
ncbi:hypothetical protein HK096_005266, partial [Nowakowskiella sp. JEL0078]